MPGIAIIHYLPVEFYPPVTNFINTLCSDMSSKKEIKIFTCHNNKNRQPYIPNHLSDTVANFKIHRSPFPNANDKAILRLFKYLHFNLRTLLYLISQKPTAILYYESFSAWPVAIYTKFFNRHCSVFVHHHEYASPDWYSHNMRLVKYYHNLEKKWLFPNAVWNSQTNADRVRLFTQDHSSVSPSCLNVMPNYPPRSWQDLSNYQLPNLEKKGSCSEVPLKIVYIGSLSFQNTYIKEFCEWIIKSDGSLTFDIYSYNLDTDLKIYLANLNTKHIRFIDGGIEYSNIPTILSEYHVGVIFYKPYNANVINCVSNKFFEYAACGLDIWYSDIMKSTHIYNTQNTYPQVIPIDFSRLNEFNWKKSLRHEQLAYKPFELYCEDVYKELIDEMIRR